MAAISLLNNFWLKDHFREMTQVQTHLEPRHKKRSQRNWLRKKNIFSLRRSHIEPCFSSSASFSFLAWRWSRTFSSHRWAFFFRSVAPPDITPDFWNKVPSRATACAAIALDSGAVCSANADTPHGLCSWNAQSNTDNLFFLFESNIHKHKHRNYNMAMPSWLQREKTCSQVCCVSRR